MFYKVSVSTKIFNFAATKQLNLNSDPLYSHEYFLFLLILRKI